MSPSDARRRRAVAVGRRAEVERRIRRPPAAGHRYDPLKVADAHVVRLECEVVPTEIAASGREVAHGRAQRLHRREALVHVAAPRGEPARADGVPAQLGAVDPPCELPALADVHVHVQEVSARRRDDLRQAGCRGDVTACEHVRPARALDEDEAFEQAHAEAAATGGTCDPWTPAGDARGSCHDAARARGEKAAIEPVGGCTRERSDGNSRLARSDGPLRQDADDGGLRDERMRRRSVLRA
jgi:hypothetical protein